MTTAICSLWSALKNAEAIKTEVFLTLVKQTQNMTEVKGSPVLRK